MTEKLEQLIEKAQDCIEEIDADELQSRLDSGNAGIVIDVRERDELGQGLIPGAKHLSKGFLECQIEALLPDADTEVVLYCQSGRRSLLAAKSLYDMGYRKVYSLANGFKGWVMAGGNVEKK